MFLFTGQYVDIIWRIVGPNMSFTDKKE